MTQPQPVIAVFDIGKTNKNLFLFDEAYRIVYETSTRFDEIEDEDGEPCEELKSLSQWVLSSLQQILAMPDVQVKAVNFSTYGASLVYLDEQGAVLTPLYNYLKAYPADLKTQFYATYGSERTIAMQTASPALGSLNSGLQLYRLKYEQPEVYSRLKSALHLPQYMSYILTGKPATDMTSIGCHTALWDFNKNQYHDWVLAEGLTQKLAPILPGDTALDTSFDGYTFKSGIGLHDSSAALIPYLVAFKEPFILLSTGTWNISLNPFDHTPLRAEELKKDCLNYIQYQGAPVKASRLFAGYECEQQTLRIAAHFGQQTIKYAAMALDAEIVNRLYEKTVATTNTEDDDMSIVFGKRDLNSFDEDAEAYHQLMIDIVERQKQSIKLIMNGTPVKQLFVDGGFSKNSIFMHLLAAAFPELEVYAASVAQATAVGAALAIHHSWNSQPLPSSLIKLRSYSRQTAS
jgi:sugar (pentulose or hexulose) kinase